MSAAVNKIKDRIWRNVKVVRQKLEGFKTVNGLRKLPRVNCSNCIYAERNEDGGFIKCGHFANPHNVYIPKLDTYNGFPWELNPNYKDPKTGEDVKEEEIRNIENKEETDIRLLRHSLGKDDPGITRNILRKEYTNEIFVSRLPYVLAPDGTKRKNNDFCLFHQFNRAMAMGAKYYKKYLIELLRFYEYDEMDPDILMRIRGRIPKFRKIEVTIENPSNSIPVHKFNRLPVEKGVYSYIRNEEGEAELVFVPAIWMADTSSIYKAIFISNKGKNTFRSRVDSLVYKGYGYSKAKEIAWEAMERYVPKVLMELAEYHTNWKSIPHVSVNEEALREAKKALKNAGIDVQDDAKPQEIFKMYRKMRQEMPQNANISLEGKEKLAEISGNMAITPKGTLITRSAQERYTNTIYVVPTKVGKMLACEFNELSPEEREKILLNKQDKKFVYTEDITPITALLTYDDEEIVDWALENENRAYKLLVDEFNAEMRFFREEALKELSSILYRMEKAVEVERRCIICGKKLSKYNDGDECFSCKEAGE